MRTADTMEMASSERCTKCQRKVGLVGIKCRCGGTFCSAHRYTNEHACPVDYKTLERPDLPRVVPNKIEKL